MSQGHRAGSSRRRGAAPEKPRPRRGSPPAWAEGSAYSLPNPRYRADLTEVERGTPMGELMRRYWQPIGLAADAGETPRRVRVLGEDLILFRDRSGRAGLLYPRCCHRGADLFYGRAEPRGLRCCYHGWLFDVEGRCLEMPMEPDRGERRSRTVRQPWYPVQERYGLVFAYMGPPERRPALPRFELLDVLAAGEQLEADASSIGSGGGVIAPCNWLQHYENVMDPYHVPVLHGWFSGTQFVDAMGVVPEVRFERFERGVRSHQHRVLDDGRRLHRITECVLPNVRVVADPTLTPGRCSSIGWVLPIDSTRYRVYTVARVHMPGALAAIRARPGGKRWFDMTEAEHQRFPGDWEAQVGQGPITFHSEEHLARTDQGIRLLRAALERELAAIASGGDPVGWSSEEGPPIASRAGNFFAP